jgi:hypothetical protein
MTRYVAFLRGVSPQKREDARAQGVLRGGGVRERAHHPRQRQRRIRRTRGVRRIARATRNQCDAAGARPHVCGDPAAVRIPRELVASDPFARFDVPPDAKRVVTFLRRPAETVRLPIGRDGATILGMADCEVFTAYLPSDKGPVFMSLLERTFGTDITTRTVDTVAKCAVA